MRPRTLPLAVSLLLGCAGLAHASLEDAADSYRRGAAMERAGDNADALVEYQAALGHDPQYFYAWRQMGNCYVRLRQVPKAIDAYDRYLAAKPDDLAVRDYAERLRKAADPAAGTGRWTGLGSGSGSGASSGTASAPARNEFFAGVLLRPVLMGTSDLAAMVPSGASGPSGSSLGLGYGLEGGWRHASGFYGVLGYYTGLNKNFSWTQNSGAETNAITSHMGGFYVGPGYRYRLPLAWPLSVEADLGIGQAQLSYAYTVSLQGQGQVSSVSVNQAATLLVADLKAVARLWQGLDLEAGLGYQGAALGQMNGPNGTIQDAQGNNAKLDDSGLDATVAVEYGF